MQNIINKSHIPFGQQIYLVETAHSIRLFQSKGEKKSKEEKNKQFKR